jgi:hypothetical protein
MGKIFSLVVETGSEAHPASYPIGTGALSPGIKRPGPEAGHSPAISAEVKNNGSVFIVKHRDNFTFTFTCFTI